MRRTSYMKKHDLCSQPQNLKMSYDNDDDRYWWWQVAKVQTIPIGDLQQAAFAASKWLFAHLTASLRVVLDNQLT